MKYTTLETPDTSSSSNNNISSIFNTTMTGNSANVAPALFCEQVCTVTSLFEKWNDCERTVVMYALLKRLRYPSLKFLQYSIDSTLTQNMGSESNLSTVVLDINANNPSYLQNLLNSYKTFHMGDVVDTLSSSSSDKDSMPCYGSDFQITQCDERRLYGKKEDILHEVLNMLPLLKPTNVEAKLIYLALIPIAVKDTMHQIVPTDLVQQIFSYLLIHPSISSEDRRSLNVWLRHLEDHIQSPSSSSSSSNSNVTQQHNTNNHSFFLQPQSTNDSGSNLKTEKTAMTTSSGSSASSSSASCSSTSNVSVASSMGNLATNSISSPSTRNADWQTIAPPSKVNQQLQTKMTTALPDWSSLVMKRSSLIGGRTSIGGGSVGGVGVDTLCDNLNGITLNELGSSQNSLRLSLSGALLDATTHAESSSSSTLVSGVVAGVSVTAEATDIPTSTNSLFGSNTNPIISIMSQSSSNNCRTNNNNSNNNCSNNNNDNDTSFSKNGTEIIDFDPNSNVNTCGGGGDNGIGSGCQPLHQMGYASILMRNTEQMDSMNRWCLDSKLATLKTRRSNSLTTQTISSSGSSSNSSVITVNDNCSNSTENLAQFANKPRSYSLSIEHPRAGLTNSGSDTRLDDFKPNYIKFQTRSVGMSCIGLWLKSLRLHKYIDLFKNMTYEEMLQITEEYLQSLGVTKGASHKLALCIEKLKERASTLAKLENDLLSGQLTVQSAAEDLANMVLTPMKPVEAVTAGIGEENVALRFLNALDLVCSLVHKEHYCTQDEENISVIMWILDRSIHNEAFLNHANQLKDLKFRLSKLKMAMAPKMHHMKSSSGGNLNKPRWNGKNRKCEPKNGSNDRINHRKNSNDMLNFSLSCLQQQQQQQQLHNNNSNSNNANNNNNNNNSNNQPQSEYDMYYQHSYNNINNGQQYKSSSYPSFIKQQLEAKQFLDHMPPQTPPQYQSFPIKQQQQQQMSQQQQQHRRSLNNLIVVSGGPQQPQKMIFKLGQGVLSSTSTTTTSAAAAPAHSSTVEALKIETALIQQRQQIMQQRKASLTIGLNNNTINSNNIASTNPDISIHQQQQQQQSSQQQQLQTQQHQQQQQQKPKNSMSAIVMVSSDDIANNIVVANSNHQKTQQQQQPQILISNNNNNNSNMLNNNLLCQQQQQQQHQREHQNQQLQLLAAAAAAVGNMNCICNSSISNSNNNISNNSKSNCSNCNCCPPSSSSAATNAAAYDPSPLIANINLPIENKYLQQQHLLQQPPVNHPSHHHHNSQHHHHHVTNAAAAMNDIKSLEQLETLCLQMTEQAIN